MRGRDVLGGVVLVALATTLLLSAPAPVLAQAGQMQRIQYGEIVHAEAMKVVEQRRGQGAHVGSTVGAVAGYALVDRGDRWLGGLLGGVVGAAVGNAVEKKSRTKHGWQLIIKLDSGEEIGVQVPAQQGRFAAGDRVRMMSAGNQTRVMHVKQ